MSDPERPSSGYAAQMTAGGAWIDIPAADMAEQVAFATQGAAWADGSVRTANANRRDLRDCYGGRIAEPIHAAADRVVTSQVGVADHAQLLLRWWTRAQDQIAGTKSMILRAVDLGLQEIEAIEAATGIEADKKKEAIDKIVEMVHGENLEMVNGAVGMIGPAPQPHYTPPFIGQGSPVQGAGMSNKPGASITGLKNERGIGKSNGSEDGKSSERGGVGHGSDSKDKNHDKAKDGSAQEKDEADSKADRGNAGHGSSKGDDDVKLLERGNADHPASIQPIHGQQPSLPMSPASPLSGAGAGGGSPASGMSSLGSSLGRGPSASGLGSGTGAGAGGPASTPVASQASLLRAFGGPAGLDSAAAGPVARPAPVPSAASGAPAAVPITAAQGTPVAPVQPAAAPAPVPPAPPAQTAAPLTGGGLPLMGPAPATANPLSSAPAAAPLSATAGPAVPLAAGGGASTSATVVPMTPGERARQLVARSTRQMLGDLAGEVRRLAAALTASTKNLPTLQWVVGGCPDDGSGQLMVVASSAGLGFIPASTRLPRHTAVHVFGESPNVPWGIKRGWMGNPLKAVQGYGVSINRPVTVVAGRPEALAGAAGVGVEFVTAENIPDGGVQGGRDRLEVVDPAQFDQISGLGTAALAALLPTAGGFEVEPNNERTLALWTAVDMAATVGESHLIKAWQDFCTDQATASAYKVTRADSDLTARQYYSDYAYFVWNLAQLEKALEAAA